MPPVLCAPDQVQRVLHNLLTNAIRHTPPDGSIAIVVSPDEHDVTIAVEDTGEGVSHGHRRAHVRPLLARGFLPHLDRVGPRPRHRTRASSKPTGGRIWAENRPHGGARVAFTLPTTTT